MEEDNFHSLICLSLGCMTAYDAGLIESAALHSMLHILQGTMYYTANGSMTAEKIAKAYEMTKAEDGFNRAMRRMNAYPG